MSETGKTDIKFWHINLETDAWQRVAALCKSAHLWLHDTPYDLISKDDILVFADAHNPYAKCICKVLSSRWFPGFRTAFNSTEIGTLGYIRGEKIAASYHDFADDYTLNQVRAHGVVNIVWKLLSCEYIKYTDETNPRKVKPRAESEFDPEAGYEYPKDEDDDLPEMPVTEITEVVHPVVSISKELEEADQKTEQEQGSQDTGATSAEDVVNLPLSDEGEGVQDVAVIEGTPA